MYVVGLSFVQGFVNLVQRFILFKMYTRASMQTNDVHLLRYSV